MLVEINIKKVVVISRSVGTDKVLIYTANLPPTTYPYEEPGSLMIEVAKGCGVKYVIDNFGIEPEYFE